jgi:hypothetical protein
LTRFGENQVAECIKDEANGVDIYVVRQAAEHTITHDQWHKLTQSEKLGRQHKKSLVVEIVGEGEKGKATVERIIQRTLEPTFKAHQLQVQARLPETEQEERNSPRCCFISGRKLDVIRFLTVGRDRLLSKTIAKPLQELYVLREATSPGLL